MPKSGVKAVVLVVDDNLFACEAVLYELRKSGFEIVCARTLAEAMTLLGAQNIDVVVTDQCLPDGRGSQLIEWLRSGQAAGVTNAARLPVILWTLLMDFDNAEYRMLQSWPAVRILHKSGRTEVLSHVIEEVRRGAELAPQAGPRAQ